MNTKTDRKFNLQEYGRRVLGIGISAAFVVLAASGLQAGTLWTNGSLNASANGIGQNRCDSGSSNGVNVCNSGFSGTAAWTIFDNFSVPTGAPWLVSGFDFTDFLVNVPAADYQHTNWSIWAGDPLSGGKLVASGTAIANISGCPSNGTCVFNIVLGANVVLAGGATYYLGTGNILNVTTLNNEESDRAYANGGNTATGGVANPLTRWEQSNGTNSGIIGSTWNPGGTNYTFNGPGGSPNNPLGLNESATAFDIQGVLSPEPGTMTLMGIALAGLIYFRRRYSTQS